MQKAAATGVVCVPLAEALSKQSEGVGLARSIVERLKCMLKCSQFGSSTERATFESIVETDRF